MPCVSHRSLSEFENLQEVTGQKDGPLSALSLLHLLDFCLCVCLFRIFEIVFLCVTILVVPESTVYTSLVSNSRVLLASVSEVVGLQAVPPAPVTSCVSDLPQAGHSPPAVKTPGAVVFAWADWSAKEGLDWVGSVGRQ